MELTRKVLARPITFSMIFVAIVVVGIISLLKLPVQLMPNTSFGEISIIYQVRGGIPPDKIENFVARPVEEAIGGVDNLKDIISISEEGRATIVMKFTGEADMNVAVMEVREKIAQIKHVLPREVERPIVAQYEQEDIPILIIGVTAEDKSAEEVRKVVDSEIKELLFRVEGVANVDVYGGRERKIMVDFLPTKLEGYNLSVTDIINTLNRANVSLIAGDIGEDTQLCSHKLKTTGRFESIEEIRNLGIAVSDQGSIVRFRDIAVVSDSFMEPSNISRLDDENNVTIYIQKETMASTVRVCESIIEQIEKIRIAAPDNFNFSIIKNDAVFINKAINSMKESLIIGSVLAAAVLLIFLHEFRLTFIIFLSIPISVFIAITMMYFFKVSLNVMTLGGLALGVGMLMDNSIVVIENIFRRSQGGQCNKETVIEGSTQVIIPIIGGTLTTIIVFLPIIFLSEEIKKLQGDMAMTITFSLVASLFVSLTLIPLLFAKFVSHVTLKEKKEAMAFYYGYFLQIILKYRFITVASVFAVFSAAIIYFAGIDMNLYETQEENKFTINVELPTGAKIEASDERVAKVEALLAAVPEVETVSSKIEKWSSKIYVTLTPKKKRKRTKEEIKDSLRPHFKQVQPAFIYFKESQEMASKEVFVELYGRSFKVLKELAMNVGGAIKGIKDLEDVKLRMREGRPEKLIMLDRRKVALAGLNIADLAQNLHARLRGLIATRYHERAQEIEVITKQIKESLTDFKDVYNIKIKTPAENYVKLIQLAEVEDQKGPSEIWRKNKVRMVQVSASRREVSLEKAVELIKKALTKVKFPEKCFYEIGGDYEMLVKSKKELYLALIMTTVMVFLVLGSIFESYYQPIIIMVSVPLSFIGVAAALLITRSKVSIGVIMGVIMLTGIVVNNAIILVDRINSMDPAIPFIKRIMEGCQQRLRPIFMTVSTTILGLLPLAIRGGEGSGLWKPLSITVIGGLISSTVLVLFIVPCIYMIFGEKKATIKEENYENNRISS
ncbi:efflux RND transporter permease subunit [Elusimicrobiota bacterium]